MGATPFFFFLSITRALIWACSSGLTQPGRASSLRLSRAGPVPEPDPIPIPGYSMRPPLIGPVCYSWRRVCGSFKQGARVSAGGQL